MSLATAQVWTFQTSCNEFEPSSHCPGEPGGKQEHMQLPATFAHQEPQWATEQMHFVTFPGQGGTAGKKRKRENVALEFRTTKK